MKLTKITLSIVAFLGFNYYSAQFASTPCSAGPLATSCTTNIVNLTNSFTNSGVANPSTENGVGCSSVGSDITAGTIGGGGGSQAYDGWYTTTVDAAGNVDVYAAIITGDPVVGIYTGPCTSPTLVICDDDGGTGLDANASATGLTPGSTVWVRVWDYAGGTGTYEITATGGTPPVNDDCANASGLTLNAAPTTGTNYCSTTEPSDYADCESNTENNVWYSFTTTTDGDITVNFSSIDCFGSGQGIDVTVFNGNCASFASYGCTSVNAGTTGNITQFFGPAGTYYVMVDGNNSGGATALCDFNIDVDFAGCLADAGTNLSPASVTACANTNITTIATSGSVNTYLGTDPCIGWGFWVLSDPLGVFPGMTNIGDLPSGNNPAGVGGDPNYAGVWTSIDFPLANGETPTLPAENNGVTYYVAPITLSNCQTGEITTNCFDIGSVTELYHNPEIAYSYTIDCDAGTGTPATSTTEVTLTISGGTPLTDGSNFTLSHSGDGTLSSTTVANAGSVTISSLPHNGSFTITITDASGCSEIVNIGPIDAGVYCPVCAADIGNWNVAQTGDGSTVSNSNGAVTGATPSIGPFILCYGDFLDIDYLGGATLPDDGPGPADNGVTVAVYDTYPTTLNPDLDPSYICFDMPAGGGTGGFSMFPDENNGLTAGLFTQDGCGTNLINNTAWLVITTYDEEGSYASYPFTPPTYDGYGGEGCISQSAPIQVTWLNDILASPYQTCGQVQLYVTGGYPEFFPGNYNIVLSGGSAGTLSGTPITHGESVTINGLTNGDTWSIDVTDGTGCTKTISGTYTFVEPIVSFATLATDYCENDPVVNLTGSPAPATVTGGTFDLDFTEDGWSVELTWEILDNNGNIVFSGTGDGQFGGCPCGSYGYTSPNLLSSDGPYTLVMYDSFGDGQDGTSNSGAVGTTTITNNVTGQVVATTSGNWGASITLALGNFNSSTGTFTGPGIADNGDGTSTFNPANANIGTNTVTYTWNNNDGCNIDYSQNTTVHPNPLLAPTSDPTICGDETILLSDYSPGEANGVAGTGTWYTNIGMTTPAPTTSFTPTNGQTFYYQYVSTTGACTDDANITFTVNPVPSTPLISSTAATCSADEISTISNYVGTNTYVFTPAGPTVGAGGVVSGMTLSTSYTVTADNGDCISAASAAFANDPMLITPATPTISSTAATCASAEISTISNYNGALTYTFTPAGPTVGAGGVVSGMTDATDYTVVADNGDCSSASSATFNNDPMLVTPATPTISSTAATCASAEISTISNYNGALTYTFTPAGPTVGAGGVVSGMTDATDYTVIADNGDCSSASSATFNNDPILVTPATPTISSTAATCASAEISTISNYNGALTYTFTPAGPTVGAGGVVSGMTDATDYTVIADNGDCSSASSATFNNDPILVTPATPTISSTAATCASAEISTISNYNGALTYTFTPAGPTVGAGGVVSGMTDATDYTVVADNGDCSSASSATFNNDPILVTPATPTISSTAATCASAEISTISNYNGALTYTFTPAGPTVGAGGVVSGMTDATDYTVIADNGDCSSASSATFNNDPILVTPATPTISSTAATCASAEISTISNYNGALTYTFTPAGPTVGAGGVVSGMTDATDYTVVADNGDCSSASSATFNNDPILVTPATPTISSTAATCASAEISTISNYNGALTYTFTPAGPTVGAGGVVSGMTDATDYTVIADNGDCSSASSATFNNDPMLVTPATPTISSTAATCASAEISTISNYNGALTYTFTPAGPTVGAGGVVSGMTDATDYTVIADNGDCSSASSATFNNDPILVTPATPTISSTAATCASAEISTISNYNGALTYTFTPAGPTVGAGGVVSGMTDATDYTVVADNGDCSSASSATFNNDPILVTPTVSIPTDICIGATTNVTPTTGGTWSSSDPAATIDNSGLITGISANTGVNFTFLASNGCSATTLNMNINALPNVTAADVTICEGTSLDLTGGDAGLSYSWSGPLTFTSTSQSPNVSASATPAMSGTYTLIGTDGNMCSNSANGTIVVNALPTIDDSGISENDPSACGASDGSITGLVGSGAATLSYTWTGGSSQASPDNTGISAGSYSIVIEDGNGCVNTYGPYAVSDPTPPTPPTLTPTSAAVCIGGDVTIAIASPEAGATYTWTGPNVAPGTTGTSLTITNATLSDAGAYDVSTEISGCTVGNAAAQANITVNSLPVVDVLAPITVDCNNPVIDLDGSNSEQGIDITYTWTTALGGVIIGSGNSDTETTSTAGDYDLQVENTTTGCIDNQTVSVVTNFDTPVSDIVAGNGGQLDCANPSISLDGNGSTNQAGGTTGITYAWSTTSGGTPFANTVTTSATVAGDYYLTITETASGCTHETMVTVNAATGLPAAIITGNDPLTCAVTSITVDGSTSTPLASVDYEWNTNPVTAPLGAASTLNITTTGDYTLTVTDPLNSCVNSINFTVIEDIVAPSAVVNTPLVVDCNNPVVVLDGTGSDQGTNFTYAWTNPGTGVIIGTADADSDSTSTDDTYTLTVTNTTNGCTSSEDIIVSMDTITPIADAGADVNFPCGVTNVPVDGSASSGTGITYDWSGPGTISDNTIAGPTVNSTGTYNLTITSANGCSASSTVDVIPDINAPVADAGSDITIDCNSFVAPLSITLDGSGSDAGMDYLWSTTGTGNITNGTTTAPTVDEAGTYEILVTNTANSCSATATVTITMDTIAPVANAGTAADIDCNSGLVTSLDASASTGNGLTYNWTTTSGTIDSQSNGAATVSAAGDYQVLVTQINGCVDSATITVAIDTITPNVVIATPGDIDCNGSSVVIDASGTTGSNETYLWSTTETTNTITVNAAGAFSVTVTNDNGCSSTGSVTINNLPAPIADFSATPISGQIPLNVDFTDNSTGTSLTYDWQFGDGNSSTIQDPSNTFDEIGDFTTILTVTDAAGCSDTASITITVTGTSVLIVPNIFTPNGDGENDIFNVDGTNITEIKGTVINRWGQIVYEWDVLEIGWDGHTVSGAIASEGVYYYLIDAVGADGTVYNLQGPFELIR